MNATPNIPRRDSPSVLKAREVLQGAHKPPAELLDLARALKEELRFAYARRVLLRATTDTQFGEDPKTRTKILQQLALCTYKDQELPADLRLDRAFQILVRDLDLKNTHDQETLGLAGSIHKRKWEVDNQRQNLELSLYYYLRGYSAPFGPVGDQGYTGINAAFVLDQLAKLDEQEARKVGGVSQQARERRQNAKLIREDIVDKVSSLLNDSEHTWVAEKWWYYATVAEAHFGLRDYQQALEWLRKGQAAVIRVFEWELETSARQLAALARLQQDDDAYAANAAATEAWQVLKEAFGGDAVARSAFVGKVGLALSGGGFRASLYHIGVLAYLAEANVLRQVDVLSCVSGGSIVGAYYYLLVRRLLQRKTDAEIEAGHYVAIVREMIDEFVAGVQKNIRMRVLANPLRTLQMLWRPGYSRTKRAGELYERHLYARIDDGEGTQPRWLNGMTIAPLIRCDEGGTKNDHDFTPVYQNWRRESKVPILVLNATTLNTGHTWQFAATWMGESQTAIDAEVDGNECLRRMYYTEAPREHKRVRLGEAVGASAAVPGIFDPITLDRLYPDRIVRLVDGGVCDNQGVASLTEQDCRVMLVSDASGQMEAQPAVSAGVVRVLLRTNDVFQARIRTAEYHDLKSRRRSGLLRGFMFVHLKGDLDVDPVDWIDCADPFDASDDARPASRRGPLTRYGIAKDIQELLSAIRTDLDSFSDAEAYALMTSGYRMTQYQFEIERCVEGFERVVGAEPWKFLAIEPKMKAGTDSETLRPLLAAGSSLGFKVWQIDPWLKYGARIGLLAVLVSISVLIVVHWREGIPPQFIDLAANLLRRVTVKGAVVLLTTAGAFYVGARLLAALLGKVLAQNVVRIVRWKDTLRRIGVSLVFGTIGCVVAVTHLLIFDRRFLRLGKLDRL